MPSGGDRIPRRKRLKLGDIYEIELPNGKKTYNINEELVSIAKIIPYNPFVIKAANIYLTLADKLKRIPDDCITKKFTVSGYRNRPVSVEVIEPVNNNVILPAMLYIHGGAFSYRASTSS